MGRVAPGTADRGSWKNKGIKDRGWVVRSRLPSLKEAVGIGYLI